MNRAVVCVPDQRLNRLAEMYRPQKVVPTTLDVVDIPGIKAGSQGDGPGFRLLGHIKNVEALLHVVRCFEDGNVPFEYETIDPAAAGKIHTDIENGFIRMEVIRYQDLVELGSEAAVAKAGRQRIKGLEYERRDGDMVVVRFNGNK